MKKLLLLLLLTSNLNAASQSDPIRITSIAPVDDGALRIAWEGSIPPYKLQTSEDLNGPWRDASFHIYANAYLVSNALPLAFYRVRTIPDHLPPPALKGFGPRMVKCNMVSLMWNPLLPDELGGTGLRGTRIYRDGVFLFEVPFSENDTIDASVQPGTTYEYWATVVDMAGNESPRSGTRIVPVLPCEPLNITLAWDPNPEPDILGYYLYYGIAPGQYDVKLDVGNHTTASIAVPISQWAYFAVSAYNVYFLEGDLSEELALYVP